MMAKAATRWSRERERERERERAEDFVRRMSNETPANSDRAGSDHFAPKPTDGSFHKRDRLLAPLACYVGGSCHRFIDGLWHFSSQTLLDLEFVNGRRMALCVLSFVIRS